MESRKKPMVVVLRLALLLCLQPAVAVALLPAGCGTNVLSSSRAMPASAAAARSPPPLLQPPLPRRRRANVRLQGDDGLVLTEENAEAIVEMCQTELATIFGSNAESRSVGITGGVSFVELDGPSVVVRLTGRFWHRREDVLERVASFVMQRIPECISVDIEDPAQLDEDYEDPPTD